MTAPVQCTPTEASRLASLRTRRRGPKLTPEREQAIVIRPCPECGSGVESDTTKNKSIKTYTCSQCGAKLWLIQSALSDRLVVAQVRQ